MKKIFIVVIVIVLLAVGGLFLTNLMKVNTDNNETMVLETTFDLSKEYLALRLRTDNILINAKEYTDYATWDQDMTVLINDWESLANQSQELENTATKNVELASINFKLVKTAHAYTTKEINDIYDKAPKFKGIATLAKHLGVDAQRAQLILNQAQNETTAEGWTEAGDTLQKLETSAVVIKDGCKVAGYVGGVVITGGAAGGFAAAGTLAQVTTVVVGVDLALEVTEDGAQIALGDKNKVSSFVKDIRTVTEPVASVLTITNIPNNLGTAYGKFESVMVGLEQFRESAQEGKVIGVDLTNFEYHPPFQVIRQTKYPGELTVAEMEKAEVEEWLKSLNKKQESMTQEEVKEFLASEIKQTASQKTESTQGEGSKDKDQTTENNTKEDSSNLAGTGWKGSLSSMSGGDNQKRTIDFDFILNSDGSVSGSSFTKWKQDGDKIKLHGEDESLGYYEFKTFKQELQLIKIVIGDEVIQPGESYMGGIAPGGFLSRKSSSDEGSSQANKGGMPFSEYNEMDEEGLFKNIAMVTEKLGEPDLRTTDEKGRIIFVYYDLVKYDSGNLGSVKMAFYNEEDYKSYIENMGGSWESNKENWDESGGGIRATSQIKPAETFKKIYGE